MTDALLRLWVRLRTGGPLVRELLDRLSALPRPTADQTAVIAPHCRYTFHLHGDSHTHTYAQPACTAAEVEPFDVDEEPYCRYCGHRVAVEEIDDTRPDTGDAP